MIGTMPIDRFKDEFAFLSNFYPASVMLDGIWYPSVENAYQAAKTLDPALRQNFVRIRANKAKFLGSSIKLRDDWEQVKLQIMTDLVTQKFTRHSGLKTRLMTTSPRQLIEGNHWDDVYWGVCNGVGTNHLGIILMNIRDTLISEYITRILDY